MNRHYYLNLGYRHDFRDDFALEGNFFSRYVSSIFMQEFMVRGIIKDAVWIGASARCPNDGKSDFGDRNDGWLPISKQYADWIQL